MNNNSTLIASLIATSLICYSTSSQSNDALPTHCRSDEIAYVNAKMYEEVEGHLGYDTGKILSLCADKTKEPLGKFVYRFGVIGKVEMEQVASIANKFGLSTQSDSGSHAGQISLSFSKGGHVYEVSEGMGMNTAGIRLSVYQSGKQILRLASNNNNYESVMVTINFEKASSKIFKIVKPIDPW